jgi:hypothetical protein
MPDCGLDHRGSILEVDNIFSPHHVQIASGVSLLFHHMGTRSPFPEEKATDFIHHIRLLLRGNDITIYNSVVGMACGRFSFS